MATEAQILANRRNAQHSTGPSSPTGKEASSRNARTHGLTGATTAAFRDEAERALVERRKSEWRKTYAPRSDDEEAAFDTLVAESIRVERCRDAYFVLCAEHGRRARMHWEADRRREADDLALGLKKTPHAVARRLEATRQGAELKLDLWRGLASALDRNGAWTDDQRSLALDLLGLRPELRDAETPADPAAGDVVETRKSLAAREIERLAGLCAGVLAESDARQRAMAESTLGAELTRPLQLLDRYERGACHRQRKAMGALLAARRSREGAGPKAALAAIKRSMSPARPMPAPLPVAPRSSTVRVSAATAPAPAPAPTRATEPAPSPAPALNRHQRRAEAARARQAAR